MSRAVFSALANAEHSDALARFVEELAQNPVYGSVGLRDRLKSLAAILRATDPGNVELGVQSLPRDAVKERAGKDVYLIGVSSGGPWTHDRFAASEPIADAWIYVLGKLLLVFEFKNDEHSLDATQISTYVHALKLLGAAGVHEAALGSTLSPAEAQAVKEACQSMVLDAPWSAVIDALQHLQEEARVGSRGQWLAEQAAQYLRAHVRPHYAGIQTILTWLNGPALPDRVRHLRRLVMDMGHALTMAAQGTPDAITFVADQLGDPKVPPGAGAALYVKLNQNGQPLEVPWFGREAPLVLWFQFNIDGNTEPIGLEYYVQARGPHPTLQAGGAEIPAWNKAKDTLQNRAKDLEDQMSKWVSKAPESIRVDVTTVKLKGKRLIFRGGGEADPHGPALPQATPQQALEFLQSHRAELWRFPGVGDEGEPATVAEAARHVRKPAIALRLPLDIDALAACGEDGLALQTFLQNAVARLRDTLNQAATSVP
jgi:hypothetical protein